MPKKKTKTITFAGWIMLGRDGDFSSALYVIDHRTGSFDQPLVESYRNEVGWLKKQVSINYHITDEPFSGDDLNSMLIAKMCGVSHSGTSDADYSHKYSEMTGYLWTEQNLKVGGHDLVEELRTYAGKWVHLTILVHE